MKLKINLYLLIVLLTGILSFKNVPERTNFSGKWKINAQKTMDIGGTSRHAANTFLIEQTDKSIKITTWYRRDPSMVQTITFDGKECDQIALDRNFETDLHRSVAKWSDDGKELTTSFTYLSDVNKGLNGNDTMSIQNGSLVVKTQAHSHSFLTKWVYDKE